MNLKSVMMARAIWLFDINDLNPKGKSIFPDIFEWLKDQYHFQKVPGSMDDKNQQGGLTFTNGEFQVKEEIFIEISLELYNDGFVATSKSSTADSERFLSNLMDSLSEEYSLVFAPSMIRRKVYVSELNVETTGSLAKFNGALNSFSKSISTTLGIDPEHGFELTGLIFGTDPTVLPISQQFSGFQLERKIQAPFSENRFYSKAPLPTDKHMELLDKLENLMS
jgi:hypothetical protein